MGIVYLFKRDLRIEDNKGLSIASQKHKEILPIFVFDTEIIRDLNVDNKRLAYLVKSVESLSQKIDLYCFYDTTEEALKKVFEIYKPSHLYTTTSYSWKGKERNEKIKKLSKKYAVEYVEILENFLVNPEELPTKKVYTPFYKEWINRLKIENYKNYEFSVPKLNLPKIEDIKLKLKISDFPYFDPTECRKRLENFPFENYEKTRDYPYIDGSSKLSPCIRFGILSLREIFKKAHLKSEQFVKELAWREFWYHIAINFPETREIEFQEKRRSIQWQNKEEYIRAFQEGTTGYPIIDSAIRQIKEEKWLHNRMRMILASFLTKVLLVDWRIGEEFFKKHLLDYDEVVNFGNWQWSASVGADPKPFRFFNPILQTQKFDPECQYIKKYLPELSKLPCYMLTDPLNHKLPYHKPIVNYYERIQLAKKLYGL